MHVMLADITVSNFLFSVNEEWYYGSSKGSKGIFPKCYVE